MSGEQMMAACPKYDADKCKGDPCPHSVEHKFRGGWGECDTPKGWPCPACTPVPAVAPPVTFDQWCESHVDQHGSTEIAKLRGGCSCHVAPPCGSCCEPITEDEAMALGWRGPTVPAVEPPPPVKSWHEAAGDLIEQQCATAPRPSARERIVRAWDGEINYRDWSPLMANAAERVIDSLDAEVDELRAECVAWKMAAARTSLARSDKDISDPEKYELHNSRAAVALIDRAEAAEKQANELQKSLTDSRRISGEYFDKAATSAESLRVALEEVERLKAEAFDNWRVMYNWRRGVSCWGWW